MKPIAAAVLGNGPLHQKLLYATLQEYYDRTFAQWLDAGGSTQTGRNTMLLDIQLLPLQSHRIRGNDPGKAQTPLLSEA